MYMPSRPLAHTGFLPLLASVLSPLSLIILIVPVILLMLTTELYTYND